MFERCKKADILEKSGELLCRAKVKVGRAGDIVLVIPTAAEYHANANYHVLFYDPNNGLVTCKCRLSPPVTLPGGQFQTLRCEVQDRVAANQRRQDLKIQVQINIMLHAAFQPGDTFMMPEGGVPAIIDNISAGGVYFRTATNLPVGRRVWFALPGAGEELTPSAQILRSEKVAPLPGSTESFGYGCKFVNMLSRQETLLRSFVFQEERKQRSQDRR
ncbi:MAG: PilZ domain-containing protein [Oscillospiraceae bacterium]|nr:PilZ domain-containing protein [Oscillospiraceae bacterium]